MLCTAKEKGSAVIRSKISHIRKIVNLIPIWTWDCRQNWAKNYESGAIRARPMSTLHVDAVPGKGHGKGMTSPYNPLEGVSPHPKSNETRLPSGVSRTAMSSNDQWPTQLATALMLGSSVSLLPRARLSTPLLPHNSQPPP